MRAVVGLSALAVLAACTAERTDSDPSTPSGTSHAVPQTFRPSALFETELPGSPTSPGCIEVTNSMQSVLSRDFIAGDFRDFRGQWAPRSPTRSKLWWSPRHPEPGAALELRATSASGRELHLKGGPLSSTDSGAMYPSAVPLPTRGTWTIRVDAGRDHGCFTFRL